MNSYIVQTLILDAGLTALKFEIIFDSSKILMAHLLFLFPFFRLKNHENREDN